MSQPFSKTLNTDLVTESGAVIGQPVVAYQTWGELNSRKDNAVLICHALTGNTNAAEWFGGIIGPGKAIDPEELFVICPNVLGSCYGTTGPSGTNPATGKVYKTDFPEITIRDIVKLHQLLLDELKVQGIELVIGGSLGGMQALEFVIMDERARSAALIGMGKSHTPWAIGISHAQRKAIYTDPNWKDGNYDAAQPPKAGLAAARAMAMLTYRSPDNYEQKFGREVHPEKHIFQVESYLDYQGNKLVNRFDARTYVTLTKAMDTHDVSRGRGSFKKVLSSIEVPVLVVGIESDLLYPIQEQEELADLIPQGSLAKIDSPYGHDAFLIEFEQLNQHLKTFQKELTHSKII